MVKDSCPHVATASELAIAIAMLIEFFLFYPQRSDMFEAGCQNLSPLQCLCGILEGNWGPIKDSLQIFEKRVQPVFRLLLHMGGCQSYGPFLDPYYNTTPNI